MNRTAPLTLFVIVVFIVFSCNRDTMPPVIPVVNGFTPALGLPGDTVTITGTHFSATVNKNSIKFGNNIPATILSSNDSVLTVKVPQGAVTGKITVTVSNQSGSSAGTFEVLKDIPRNGLVAWYPFNGNSGDASGNGHDLTFISDEVTATDSRFWPDQHAWYFNGGNARISPPGNPAAAQVSSPVTLACWIQYDSLLSSSLFGKYHANGGYIFGVTSNGCLRLTLNTGISQNSDEGVLPDSTAGEWLFVSVTYDGSTVNFYKNGSSVNSYALTGNITAIDGNMRIGLSGYTSTGPESFKCSIDDVTIYNRVLSSTEMQQLYEQTAAKKE